MACEQHHIVRAGMAAGLMMLSCIQGVSHAQPAGTAGVGASRRRVNVPGASTPAATACGRGGRRYHEEGRGRWEILLNRDHPKNVQPSYFGDSVGHWEGDTLVVDTIGLNGEIDLLSTKARVTSCFWKINGGHQLKLTLLIEDLFMKISC